MRVTLSAIRVGRRAKSLSVGSTERSFVAYSTTELLRMTTGSLEGARYE
jgi:hypothetical protein